MITVNGKIVVNGHKLSLWKDIIFYNMFKSMVFTRYRWVSLMESLSVLGRWSDLGMRLTQSSLMACWAGRQSAAKTASGELQRWRRHWPAAGAGTNREVVISVSQAILARGTGGYSDSGYCVKKLLGDHLVGIVDFCKGWWGLEEEKLFPAYELAR